jgi:hypothetical protein
MKGLIGITLVFMIFVGDFLANGGAVTDQMTAFVSSILRSLL